MTLRDGTPTTLFPRGETPRLARTRVRSWTGRAAMSLSTDSHVPTFVTAGMRRTRMSEMRLATARIGRLSRRGETAGAVCSAFQHRMSSRPASLEAMT